MRTDYSVIERIERIAAAYPERTAFKSRAGEMTYRQLWERSQQIAAALAERLARDERPVMVYGHKSPWMAAAFLGCVRAGRAYCPVDVSMPESRIRDIAARIGNPLIIATEPLALAGYEITTPKQLMQEGSGRCEDRSLWQRDEDTFYIIFTSGSTGKPKGVEISARSLQNFLTWSRGLIAEALPGGESTGVFINQAPFSFDLSVFDLYSCLTSGGTLISLDKELQGDTAAMFAFLREGGARIWVSTPSFADMCLADPAFCGDNFAALKLFLFCGERLSKETAAALMERFPQASVVNTYGPTESTVAVTAVTITEEMLRAEEALPVGRVRGGSEIFFDGEEMIIAGDTVAKGYFKDRQKTAAAFFETELKDGQKVRAYRTGDSGYCRDGYYYCTGRIDLQVKLHGYRIELGDIESNLLEIPHVQQACVVPRYDGERIRNLVSFVKAPEMDGTFRDGRFLRELLKEKLPKYMIPKNIIFIDEMPMTVNGKLDRKKLEGMLA